MSAYSVEHLMFSIQSDPSFRDRFLQSPQAVLDTIPITLEERGHILAWNVRALADSGVSDMLLMVAFTAINGQQSVPDYMRRMNTPAHVISAQTASHTSIAS